MESPPSCLHEVGLQSNGLSQRCFGQHFSNCVPQAGGQFQCWGHFNVGDEINLTRTNHTTRGKGKARTAPPTTRFFRVRPASASQFQCWICVLPCLSGLRPPISMLGLFQCWICVLVFCRVCPASALQFQCWGDVNVGDMFCRVRPACSSGWVQDVVSVSPHVATLKLGEGVWATLKLVSILQHRNWARGCGQH